MTTPLLVEQLRFARKEFARCLEGVSDEDAIRRIQPMNCLSWMVGHLSNQEQGYWVMLPGNTLVVPGLNDRVGSGKPASTPPFQEMWAAWRTVTQAADAYLETLTPERMQQFFERNGRPINESIGTLLLRNIYHYWFHIGEAHAVRQVLGHPDLPQFVGDINSAPYHPD